jgi:hypothetical protein
VVMGAVPHQSRERQLKIVGHEIPDNAEVANPDFGKNEDSSFTPVPALADARRAVVHGEAKRSGCGRRLSDDAAPRYR